MHQIHVEELSTPEAFVMRRIITSVGLNIRPEKAIFDDKTRIWTVPLKAIIPSQVVSKSNTIRTFLYRFENIGNVKLTKEDNDFKFIEFPKVSIIDDELHSQWYDLTQKVEQEILRSGESIWGELTYLKMLLRPMYTIIGEMITDHKLYLDELKTNTQLLRYVEFLRLKEYLDFNEDNQTYAASKLLTMISEKLYKKFNDEALGFIVTSRIVGGIFAKFYREIKYDLGVHIPSVYVDTSMAYYLDAIRVGESIDMTMDELWRKYRMVGHKTTTAKVGSNYPTVVSEMVLGKLLDKSENGKIYANEDVFSKLQPLSAELTQQLVEIP